MSLDAWMLGIGAFMLGITLSLIATVLLSVLHAYLGWLGRAFWGGR